MQTDKGAQRENARRIENLINLVDNHTRTERHLEQYSDAEFSNDKNIAHANKIQKEREQQIEHLKNVIAYGEHNSTDDLQNLQQNYQYTQNYLDNNADHMDKETLERTKEKQAHRKEQMNWLA
ncbi:hypothetical protein V6C27_13445 [Peptococcaceae bacterium 1198_IL3148]